MVFLETLIRDLRPRPQPPSGRPIQRQHDLRNRHNPARQPSSRRHLQNRHKILVDLVQLPRVPECSRERIHILREGSSELQRAAGVGGGVLQGKEVSVQPIGVDDRAGGCVRGGDQRDPAAVGPGQARHRFEVRGTLRARQRGAQPLLPAQVRERHSQLVRQPAQGPFACALPPRVLRPRRPLLQESGILDL